MTASDKAHSTPDRRRRRCPAQKPEKLLARIILASCPAGGTVLDPCAGAGTSAVTARKLGRRFVVIEMDRQWCCIAAKRLLPTDDDTRIQGYEDGAFLPRNA